jgi:hypothetical protein
LVENKTFVVNHNQDGTATATIKYKWGIDINHDTNFNDVNGSFDIELPQIDRLVSIDTLGAEKIGDWEGFQAYNINSGITYSLYYSIMNDPKGYQLIAHKINSENLEYRIPMEALYFMEERDDWEVDITYKCETWEGNTLLGTKTITQVYLPPSPSKVSITTTPIYIEREARIKIQSESNLFTHKLSWDYGVVSGSITEDKISDTIYDWELPGDEMYAIVGDTEKGAYFNLRCETYYEDYYLGDSSYSFYAACDEALCKPRVYTGEAEDICNSKELTNTDFTMIRGFNIFYCNMRAQAQKEAYIVKMRIYSGDKSIETTDIENPHALSYFEA